MFHSEHLQEKWAPLLDHEGGIKDSHIKIKLTKKVIFIWNKFITYTKKIITGVV